MNLIFPIFLILSSIAIFLGYVDPNYKGNDFIVENDFSTYGIKQLKEEYVKYDETENNSTKVVQDRDLLIKKNNSISEDDKAKLLRFLPDNIDNVKLIVEITDIARNRNLLIKNISIAGQPKTASNIGPDSSSYGTLNLKFTVNATYDSFLAFIKDLEDNLRLIDITDINFTSTDLGFYDFSIGLNTYWLKQ